MLSDGQKEKSSSTDLLYQTAPRLSIRCPRPPLRGSPPSPIRETPRSREPHVRGRPPPSIREPPVSESHTFAGDLRPSCLFWWRAIPPRSHAGCDVSETTQTPSARGLRHSCLFWGRAIPPRSHAGCATETTQTRKPARIGPQAPKSPPTSHIPKMYRKSPKKPHNFR